MKKTLIISGGSKGIGNAILKRFLAEGFIIYSLARSVDVNISSELVSQIQLDLIDKVKLLLNLKKLLNHLFIRMKSF